MELWHYRAKVRRFLVYKLAGTSRLVLVLAANRDVDQVLASTVIETGKWSTSPG